MTTDEEIGFERTKLEDVPRIWRCSCGAFGNIEYSEATQRIRCQECNSLTFQTRFGTIKVVKNG
jgi:hypothetical protein